MRTSRQGTTSIIVGERVGASTASEPGGAQLRNHCAQVTAGAAGGTAREQKAGMDLRKHYVYLYRDPDSEEIRYVGKGEGLRAGGPLRKRSRSGKGTHNEDLLAWVDALERSKRAPVVEYCLFESESEALAAEAALISAHWQGGRLFNRVRGHRGRFAPLGLPAELCDRPLSQPLTRTDFAQLGGALIVYIGNKDFTAEFTDDARVSAKPRVLLTDADVHSRVSRWWQIGKYRDKWEADPSSAPRLLIGVTGPPARRWVWGSMLIDNSRWAESERCEGALYSVPVKRDSAGKVSVDAKKLRGRFVGYGEVGPVIRDSGRGFGGITIQFFDVVERA